MENKNILINDNINKVFATQNKKLCEIEQKLDNELKTKTTQEDIVSKYEVISSMFNFLIFLETYNEYDKERNIKEFGNFCSG